MIQEPHHTFARDSLHSTLTSTGGLEASVRPRWFRAICGLLIHLVGFIANAWFMYCAHALNPVVFRILAFAWFLVGAMCAWAAYKDVTLLPKLHWVCRIPLVAVVFGLLQGMHVRDIGNETLWGEPSRVMRSNTASLTGSYVRKSFAKKRTRSGRFDSPTRPVNSKSFEAVTESYAFAYTAILLFMLTASPEAFDVPWEVHVKKWRAYRWFLFGIAWMNMSAIAMGIMEVDFRVGKLLRKQVNGSICNCVSHFLFRLAEVSARIWVVTTFVFTSLLLTRCHEEKFWISFALVIWHPLTIWVLHAQLLRHAVVPGAPKEPRLAHWALAYVVNITDPAAFVDRPGYVTAAQRFSRYLYTFRTFEMTTMFLVVIFVFGSERFNKDCLAEGEPPTVREHLLQYHWGMLVVFLAILVVRLLTVVCFHGCFRHYYLPIVDASVIRMKPTDHEREGSVRLLKPRGLSAMLLQVSTGISFRMFYQEEMCFDDFLIDSELGCGSYGVVAKVTCEDDCGHRTAYAMKLQNTMQMEEDASDLLCTLEESAGRERDILLQLEHPFVTRLFYYFNMPSNQRYKYESTGKGVVDGRDNQEFHRAIIMEYLELGDLEQYILSHALTSQQRRAPRPREDPSPPVGQELELQTLEDGVSSDNEGLAAASFPVSTRSAGEPQLHASEVQWLLLMRKFAAELLVVLEFVHSKDILYRDMKPSNLMLRANRRGRLHVVLGDFGLSKQIQPASTRASRSEGGGVEASTGESFQTVQTADTSDEPRMSKLDSLAGTTRYAAPEVLDIAHRRARTRYTPAVDLYSFGKTVLVMLWRTKVKEHSKGLLMPEVSEYASQSAVDMPPISHELIWATTSRDPLRRGTASSQQKHGFFDCFQHGAAVFPKVDFKILPVEASDL